MGHSAELRAKARNIELLLMDCDGVLTDGRLYFGADGEVLKVFHARDGEGLTQWRSAGLLAGIISGRNSPAVDLRARQLGIRFVRQGQADKETALDEILNESGCTREQTAYIGDDTPDLGVFKLVGLAVAVGDAHKSVKDAAHFVTGANGGQGAVREVIDLILASKAEARALSDQ
ncbi:MAG: 3-deoxy-D-manno-octulosonate 8-phosphate phosphatase [Acidobacteria bacterium OLB17]|nr:MAG: 3-deoxy-D-manno-octulosonate 8-phosphate phosphatase [Acidobacteria bacterium OLB17]MCZ2389596.1 HAD hydrolase family protein [Acidobacteriota bacterium]